MAKQNKVSKLAIWLDHSVAHFIEVKKDKVIIATVDSPVESKVRYKGETGKGTRLSKTRSTNNEKHTNELKSNQLHQYYKLLSKAIKPYDWVYIFGPTTAKNELLNFIRAKQKLQNKTYIIGSAEEMTVNQMVAKAKEVLV